MSKVKVRLNHNCSIPGTRWCEPVGWKPSNTFEGAEFDGNAWWSDYDEFAGIVWFGEVNAYGHDEVIEANLSDLRVASCGNARVLEEVTL